jgi:hypothetical protein
MDKDKVNKLYQGFADVAKAANTPEHRVRPEVLATEAFRVHHLAGQGDREEAGKLAQHLVKTYGVGMTPLIKALKPEKPVVQTPKEQQQKGTTPDWIKSQQAETPKVDPEASPEQQKRQEIAQQAKTEQKTKTQEQIPELTEKHEIKEDPKDIKKFQEILGTVDEKHHKELNRLYEHGVEDEDEFKKIVKNMKIPLSPGNVTALYALIEKKHNPPEPPKSKEKEIKRVLEQEASGSKKKNRP